MNLKLNIWKKGGFIIALSSLLFFPSCEKKLTPAIYGSLNDDNFFKSTKDAASAVSAMYGGLMGKSLWSAGFGSSQYSFTVQASQTTDEGICNWGDPSWQQFNGLSFTPDLEVVTIHYTILMPYISQITQNIAKIETMSIDDTDKAKYIAELKALRGYYMQILFLYYGPVPVRLKAEEVNNLSAPVIQRPSKDEMVNYIVKDLTDAITGLPDKIISGTNYGRFSKAACYTALLKLYMQLKNWPKAIEAGLAVKSIGFSLVPDYGDLFNVNNKNGNNETILPIVCSATGRNTSFVNIYRPHFLPTDYYDAAIGNFDQKWGGYRMPWKTYDKINKNDYRLNYLLEKYPTMKDGQIVYRDARANGDIGAVMAKYGPDPTKANSQNSSINYVAMRYADVELLLAEAINNQNGGPTSEALGYLNDVHVTHGKLPAYPSGMSQSDFLKAIQTERLSELWAEGQRRDDLIRWGLYIKRAQDDGYTADDHLILYPLPRAVIKQSNGVIQQNPGYN